MTTIALNTNATLGNGTNSISLLEYLKRLFEFGNYQEKLAPDKGTYITIAEDRDGEIQGIGNNSGGIMTCSIQSMPVVCLAPFPFSQPQNIRVPDYLELPISTFTNGSGGTPFFSAPEWTQQLWDGLLVVDYLQKRVSRNPSGASFVTDWSISKGEALLTSGSTAVCSATIVLPLNQTLNSNGTGYSYPALDPLGDF